MDHGQAFGIETAVMCACDDTSSCPRNTATAEEVLQAQDRTSNDDAESVEAKQEASGVEEQDDAEDAGINLDAESVTARGEASEDDSDMEEGEIHGIIQNVLFMCYEQAEAYLLHVGFLQSHMLHSQVSLIIYTIQPGSFLAALRQIWGVTAKSL